MTKGPKNVRKGPRFFRTPRTKRANAKLQSSTQLGLFYSIKIPAYWKMFLYIQQMTRKLSCKNVAQTFKMLQGGHLHNILSYTVAMVLVCSWWSLCIESNSFLWYKKCILLHKRVPLDVLQKIFCKWNGNPHENAREKMRSRCLYEWHDRECWPINAYKI